MDADTSLRLKIQVLNNIETYLQVNKNEFIVIIFNSSLFEQLLFTIVINSTFSFQVSRWICFCIFRRKKYGW